MNISERKKYNFSRRFLAGFALVPFLLLLLAGAFALPVRADAGGERKLNLGKLLDGELSRLAGEYDVPYGVSAAAVVPGHKVWVGAEGVSTPEPLEKMKPHMLFNIASNTKTYTAAVILLLEQDGLLCIDDVVGDYLPWLEAYPNINRGAALRQLLNHSSGNAEFARYPVFDQAVLAAPGRVWSRDDVLSMVGAPYFAPGAGFAYSNTNYYLLGMVIEAVTGEKVARVFRERLFKPLKLHKTFFAAQEEIPVDMELAHSWYRGEDQSVFSWKGYYSATFTAGSVVSTAGDLVRGLRGIFSGDLLSVGSLEKMTSFNRYGYGFGTGGVMLPCGVLVWFHSGWLRGYSSVYGYDPASGVCVVLTFNSAVGPASYYMLNGLFSTILDVI